MARALTSPELALLRSDGQWTKLYLAVLVPNTIYTARLASLPASNDNVHTITFNTGSGTLANVVAGMTLYVGTTAGAYDLGMCRIRKAPIAGTFYIGLESHISWQSSAYLTVVDDFLLDAKHAILDGGALKMDVDVAYSDQHANFNPVPVLGPHAVVWLTGATVSAQFDASSSWVHGSSISGYSWSAPGASATSGLATATPTLTYNAAGCYRVFCTVTAANGKTTTGVRHVFVYSAASMPATVFQLAQCVGDYETGGWMFDLTAEAEVSLSEIRDRSLVVLFAEDWYGSTKQSIGPISGRENIVCVGRIVGQSIRWDRDEGFVHFTVQGFHHWLNKVKGFPVQLQPATVASTWSQMPAMTVPRILWHILYWHSTAIETMDFYSLGDSRYSPDGLSMANTIWGQIADIAFSKIFATPGVDRFGRLFVEIDPQMVPAASRTWATVMALTEDDWQDGIDLQRVTVEDVSLIRLSSLNVNSSGASRTLYSLSPGHTPRRYGGPETMDRVLASTQAQSNQLAGLLLGWRVNTLPDVPVSLLENNRMFDLFPQQYAGLTVTSGDTPRGISFAGSLVPRRITLFFDNDINFMHPEFNFEGASSEQLSQNGDIPDVDDDLSIPPLPPLPPLPPIDIIVPGTTEVNPDGPVKVILHDTHQGLLFTENFYEDSVEWLGVNAGLTTTQLETVQTIVLTPSGGIYIARRGRTGLGAGSPYIAYAPRIGDTFTVIEDATSILAKFALSVPGATFAGVNAIGVNPLTGQVAYVISANNGSNAAGLYVGTGTSFAQIADLSTITNVSNAGNISYGNGYWRLTTSANGVNPRFVRISPAGGIILNVLMNGQESVDASSYHVPVSTTDTIISTWRSSGGIAGLLKITQNGGNAPDFSNIIGTLLNYATDNQMACDPTGMLIMTTRDVGARGRSSDGGASWSAMGSLPFSGAYAYAYAGGAGVESRWIAARASILRYSPDFGSNWYSKEPGNLLSIAPIPSLDIVKVVQP